MKYTTSLIKNEARNIPHNTTMDPNNWFISAEQKSLNALLKLIESLLGGTLGFFNTNIRQTTKSSMTKLQMKVGALLLLTLK